MLVCGKQGARCWPQSALSCKQAPEVQAAAGTSGCEELWNMLCYGWGPGMCARGESRQVRASGN